MFDLALVIGFQWDDGNVRKHVDKHGVSQAEAEEVFLNQPLFLTPDERHSAQETRYRALGRTHRGRTLAIFFTLRDGQTLIRVISARDQHLKERMIYAQSH